MRLDDIGFYTLTEERAAQSSPGSSISRMEILVTSRCNLRCPYCRGNNGALCGDEDFDMIALAIDATRMRGLKNIRFSGGEPTLHPRIKDIVRLARAAGAERIAISTNGTASLSAYDRLISVGVNDFSVSLDACCASDGDTMSGHVGGAWTRAISAISYLAQRAYTTVGVVLTDENAATASKTITLASELGAADIRVIPAAQTASSLQASDVPQAILSRHPILRYRMTNARTAKRIRGISSFDNDRCPLVMDDVAVAGEFHYPCIIYIREGGAPIGIIGAGMWEARTAWASHHNTHRDPICKANCLDCIVDYNNKWKEYHQ